MLIEPKLEIKKFQNTNPGDLIFINWGNDQYLALVHETKEDGKVSKGFAAIHSLKNQELVYKYIWTVSNNSSVLSLGSDFKIQIDPIEGFSSDPRGIDKKIPGVIVLGENTKSISMAAPGSQYPHSFYNLEKYQLETSTEGPIVGVIFNWKVLILDSKQEKPIKEISIDIERPKEITG